MSALFSFSSFIRLAILLVCTSTYIKRKIPSLITKEGAMLSRLYKLCVIGERLSPFIALLCFIYALQKFYRFFF